MARQVALLRGVNIASRNRIAMADLREVVEGLGYEDVKTLLMSGNAVFSFRWMCRVSQYWPSIMYSTSS